MTAESIRGLPGIKNKHVQFLHVKDVYGRDASLFTRQATSSATVDSLDVRQGSIGDCWLLAGLSALVSQYPEWLRSIMCENRDGSFSVRLGNRWIKVDGMVPFFCTKEGLVSPVGVSSRDPKELWPAIMEAAFVPALYECRDENIVRFLVGKRKRMGAIPWAKGESWVDLSGGWPKWTFQVLFGLEDFPGFRINPSWYSDAVIESCLSSPTRRVVACAGTSTEKTDAHQSDGIVYGHAYAITGTARHPRTGKFLVRLYNPWGTFEPDFIAEEEVDGYSRNDGQFYLCLDVFKARFPLLSLLFFAK